MGAARWLVLSQAALATVLLVTAALLLRTVRGLEALPLGFDPNDVTAVAVAPPATALTWSALEGQRDEVARRLAADPAVEAVGWISSVPLLDPSIAAPINREDRRLGVSEAPTAARFVIDAGAMAALRLEIVRGRGFEPIDDARGTRVALINETMARTIWPDGDPVGRQIAIDPHDWTSWITVVGIVRDVRHRDVAQPAEPAWTSAAA